MSDDAPPSAASVQIVWHDVLDSTNEEALRLASKGARGPLWVAALRQTKGRGRQGRHWETRDGNLAATLLIAPGAPAARAAQLSFVTALAVAETVDDWAKEKTQVKWPNDVLLRQRKIAGILLESSPASSPNAELPWLAIGIGINLAAHPEAPSYPATSLAAEGIEPPAPAAALTVLAASFARHFERWRDTGFALVRQAWLLRAAGLGSAITARLPKGDIAGRFQGIDEDGALVLSTAEGVQKIHAGEIFL